MLLVNTSYYAILHMTHTWARHKQVSRNRHWCQRSKDVRWSRSWTARFSSSAGVQNIHVSTLCAWEGTNTSELKAPYKRRHVSTFRCIMQGEGWGLFSQKPLWVILISPAFLENMLTGGILLGGAAGPPGPGTWGILGKTEGGGGGGLL